MRKKIVVSVDKLKSSQIVPALEELINSQGWSIVKEYVEQMIKQIEHEILEGDKDLDKQELVHLKDKRSYLKDLLFIPHLLIQEISKAKAGVEKPNINLDPYKKDVDKPK